MLKHFILLPLIALLAMTLGGCTTTDATVMDPQGFRQTTPQGGLRDASELEAGDTIELSVEIDGRMEVPLQRATINHLGFVTLPLVGDVHIGGVGIDVARSVIARRYGVYYVSDPVIMLARAGAASAGEWGQVSVLGRVQNPGPVPLSSGAGMRLSAAIQAAGGFAASANTAKIQVTRLDKQGRKVRVVVDFDEIGASGNAAADLMLMDGDIVNIPERYW